MDEQTKKKNNDQLDEKWVEWIAKSWGTFCSSCGKEKDPTNLKVIRKVGPATTVLSECEHCHLKTVMTVVPNVGMQVNQIRSDVNSGEIEKFNTPVTSNDYLDFYNETKHVHSSNGLLNLINN